MSDETEREPSTPTPADNPSLRCGMVAVIGRANVGKSTLINAIMEEKVSIVSPVAQTTRNLIRAILTEPRGQLVFLDTPGVHKAEGDLGKLMNKQARGSIEGSDVALLVLDQSQHPGIEDDGWMRRLVHEPVTVMALLNKTDKNAGCRQEYEDLWKAICAEKGVEKNIRWIQASALKPEGIEKLLNILFDHMPCAPLLFPDDMLTDFPRLLNIADIIREQLLAVLYEELPHALGVVVEKIDETEKGWTVSATIYVHKHSQKVIVLGAKGRQLRAVKRKSEKALTEMYERPVKVNLWVKAEPTWSKNFWYLKKMGYMP
ncbi:MAG: GTPase Era [Kiritimatiellae bacterium]|nr:GTPase Era [Kiritimatiellia bacterium]